MECIRPHKDEDRKSTSVLSAVTKASEVEFATLAGWSLQVILEFASAMVLLEFRSNTTI
jgi:hypothetical protein